MGLFEEAVAEALGLNGCGVADHTVEQSCHPFDDGKSCHLATEQYVVADGDLLVDEVLCDSFIDTFVASANDRDLVEHRPPVERRLIQRAATGGEQDPVCVRQRVERRGERFDHHHHACTAAERGIVDLPVDPFALLPKIVEHHVECAFLPGFADQARVEGRSEELGEDRDDVDPHNGDATCVGRSPETQRSTRRSRERVVWVRAGPSRHGRLPSSRPG